MKTNKELFNASNESNDNPITKEQSETMQEDNLIHPSTKDSTVWLDSEQHLKQYDKLPYGGYYIASGPFKDKSQAYEEISNSWQGVPGVTTHFNEADKCWYIISNQ